MFRFPRNTIITLITNITVSRKAKEEDLPKIMELINEAYEVETGNTGLAFKCQKRYLDLGEVQPFLDYFYVLRLEPKSEIIGVVKARLTDNSSILDIGPLAVDPAVQVNIFSQIIIRVLHFIS